MSTTSSKLLKSLSKGDRRRRATNSKRATSKAMRSRRSWNSRPALYEGEPCLQVVFRRQENDPELAREVEELRQRDQVTGLLNRPTFLHALEDAVAGAAQNQGQHGLLLLEPDHYQRLLQEIGLDSADALLAAIAERLRGVLDGALADGDAVAARFGEHSLAVLVRGDHVATIALAERILRGLRRRMCSRSATAPRSITASIGGVQIGEKIASVTQVLAKANHGVQSSIGVGGNRSRSSIPSAVDRAEEERIQAWVSAPARRAGPRPLPAALPAGDQPAGRTRRDLRGLHPAGRAAPAKSVPPLSFLQIAEEHGLLWEIDRWVVGHAIDVIGERAAGRAADHAAGEDHPGFARRRQPRPLCRRATGGAQASAANTWCCSCPKPRCSPTCGRRRNSPAQWPSTGCRVGLEQFGVGLDSFQLLSHFDPAFLKLDRSFMEDLPKNTANQQRVREIADKARGLGIRSIAEFVQDAGSMSILFSSGIDYVEGHFLAPAGPEMNYDFE